MANNVFAEDAMRQQFEQGVQDELRPRIPMASVSDVETESMSTKHSRYGDDEYATNSTDSTHSHIPTTYGDDTLTPDYEAEITTRVTYRELVRSAKGASGGWDIVTDHQQRHTRALAEAVHRNTYSKTVEGAGLVLDNEVLAGNTSAGTPITVSASNPHTIAVKAYELMQDAGVTEGEGMPYFMVDPQTASFYKLFGMSAGFSQSDKYLTDGWYLGDNFGFEYFNTPEVERAHVLTFTGNLVADNTISFTALGTTITLTAKASPATAGQVDIGGDADTSIENIVNCINGGAGAGSAYIALTDAQYRLIKKAGLVAVADTDADTVTITSYRAINGGGTITNGTWGTEYKTLLCGLRNSTQLLLPSEGYNVTDEKPDGFLGRELTSSQIHNAGVFTKDVNRIAKILVAA